MAPLGGPLSGRPGLKGASNLRVLPSVDRCAGSRRYPRLFFGWMTTGASAPLSFIEEGVDPPLARPAPHSPLFCLYFLTRHLCPIYAPDAC